MTQTFIGTVIGTASQKTAKICVERLVKHPRLPMILKRKKNYVVHDPHEMTIIGDLVRIQYVGKLTPRKSFQVMEILKEARKYVHPITGRVYTAPAVKQPFLEQPTLNDC